MVPRSIPYPSNSSIHPAHLFATYPTQNFEILRRLFWKRRGYFMAANLPPLPDVEQVSTNIWRILGGNSSKFTLQGTNTYLLGSGRDRILVDTAQGFDVWGERLDSVLRAAGPDVRVKCCILTHWHHDHVLGVPDLRRLSPDVRVHKHLGNSYDPDKTLTDETILDIADGQRFSVGGGSSSSDDLFEVEAVHTPGHARDHMCLLVTQSPDPAEQGCLFTGDNVLGHGTAVFEDLARYTASLRLMKSRVPNTTKRAFPGHGAVIPDARAKLDEYILHRRMREDEALNVLLYGSTAAQPDADAAGAGQEWDSMDMVKLIYHKYPSNLWEPARGGLLQVLEKLRDEGSVVQTSGGKWKASPSAAAPRSRSPVKL